MENGIAQTAPMSVKIASISSTFPCPLESHHSLTIPARLPAIKPTHQPSKDPKTRDIANPTMKCLRLSGCFEASLTFSHMPMILSLISATKTKIRAFNDVLPKTLSPDTKTGGWFLPESTPSHTFPPNNIFKRSLNVGFQHDTH